MHKCLSYKIKIGLICVSIGSILQADTYKSAQDV